MDMQMYLHCFDIARTQLHFPGFPSLHSSGLVCVARGIRKDVEGGGEAGAIFSFYSWKLGAEQGAVFHLTVLLEGRAPWRRWGSSWVTVPTWLRALLAPS